MKVLIDGQTLSTPEMGRGIGVVFKNLCEQLVANDISKEWYISVRDLSDLGHFKKAVEKRLQPIIIREALTGETYREQTIHYSQFLQETVNEKGIDAYWIPNPLMTNIVLPTELRDVAIYATIYDVIPIAVKGYLKHLTKNEQGEYKRRINVLPGWADHLIFISESARNDFERLDSRVGAKAAVIYVAVDHTKFWPYATRRKTVDQDYVLFIGGFDPRKNMEKALEAFSIFLKEYSEEYKRLKLCVVCALDPEVRLRYEKLAGRLGVSDRLILTGHVDDKTLTELYRGARVLFFPSRYEGFGLPVLEGMACGIPIVTTSVSSIPEVAGDLAYYCSVDDTRDMVRALKKALREGPFDEERLRDSVRRAREFTWSKSSAGYSRLLSENSHGAKITAQKKRLTIGCVTPWPPQRSGIADYNYEIVRHLSEYADIRVYLDKTKGLNERQSDVPVEKLSSLAGDRKDMDIVIYHIGNNVSFHKEIYKAAWDYPGIVVLHDVNIHPFLWEAFFNTDQEDLYEKALLEGYGDKGASHFRLMKTYNKPPDIWRFPMSHAIAKRSLGTIVHSLWAKEQFKGIRNVFMIPLAADANINDTNTLANEKARARFGIQDEDFLISSFGFVNKLKRIPEILKAIKILVDQGYPIQFLIAGNLIDPSVNVRDLVESLGLEKRVIITGFLSDEDYESLLRLSDIVINLRCPSMGESSAALMKAFAYGKACIVSNYRQFSEFPNSVCWKTDVDEMEVPQLVAYIQELVRNPATRMQLGENAAFFAKNYASYDLAAKLYLDVVANVIKVE